MDYSLWFSGSLLFSFAFHQWQAAALLAAVQNLAAYKTAVEVPGVGTLAYGKTEEESQFL